MSLFLSCFQVADEKTLNINFHSFSLLIFKILILSLYAEISLQGIRYNLMCMSHLGLGRSFQSENSCLFSILGKLRPTSLQRLLPFPSLCSFFNENFICHMKDFLNLYSLYIFHISDLFN